MQVSINAKKQIRLGNGNTHQYSCLENSMDRGVRQATVLGVAKSRTQLSTHACERVYTHTKQMHRVGVQEAP